MKTAASIIIVVAALIFAFFLGRSSYTPEPPKVVEKWLTKYDTVEYRDTVKIPVPQVIVRDTTIYLPGEIDTAAAHLSEVAQGDDVDAIEQAIKNVDKQTQEFAARRMDKSVRSALKGHSVDEV